MLYYFQQNPLYIPDDPRTASSQMHPTQFGDSASQDHTNFLIAKGSTTTKCRRRHNRSNEHDFDHQPITTSTGCMSKKRSSRERLMSLDDRVRQIAGKVDMYSRFFFPLGFIVFNLAYWMWFLHASQNQ